MYYDFFVFCCVTVLVVFWTMYFFGGKDTVARKIVNALVGLFAYKTDSPEKFVKFVKEHNCKKILAFYDRYRHTNTVFSKKVELRHYTLVFRTFTARGQKVEYEAPIFSVPYEHEYSAQLGGIGGRDDNEKTIAIINLIVEMEAEALKRELSIAVEVRNEMGSEFRPYELEYLKDWGQKYGVLKR